MRDIFATDRTAMPSKASSSSQTNAGNNGAWRLAPHWQDSVDRLDFAFQPIVNVHSGDCYGYEALLRHTDTLGFADIPSFFDRAYADNVLFEVEDWLLAKAVEKFAAIPHHDSVKMFVNIDSRVAARDDKQPTLFHNALSRFRICDSSVIAEISDRQNQAQPTDPLRVMTRVKQSNFKLSLDDFGTGLSGLSLLYGAEPDFLKIDRFFIENTASDARKKLFLSHMVKMAHVLGVVVIVEGVEDTPEFLVCREAGCDLVQGHVVQPPELDIALLLPGYAHIADLSRTERRQTPQLDQRIISEEMTPLAPISLASSMGDVFERFRADKTATFFPVTDGTGEPVGIVREHDLKEYTYSPFGKELMNNKSFGKNLRSFVTRSPMADINSQAESILQVYSTDGQGEGIIIVDNLKYVGFLTAQSLLKVINEKNLAAARDQNPLTKLPGNSRIHQYVTDAMDDRDSPYVMAYFDFDNFKPFNDKYGFRIGDRAILLFAETMIRHLTREGCFSGHVGGDDFFAGFKGFDYQRATKVVTEIAKDFSSAVESFYDDQDRARGYIEAKDRQGHACRLPLLGVSAAVICLEKGRHRPSVDEISHIIADLKKPSKESPDHLCAASLV